MSGDGQSAIDNSQADAAILACLGIGLQRDADGVASPVATSDSQSPIADGREAKANGQSLITDSQVSIAKWQFLHHDGSIGVCAWCQEEQGVEPLAGQSHGICPPHRDIQIARARELNRRVAA